MSFWDWFKSDEQKQREERDAQLLWAQQQQGRLLHDGGEGLAKRDLARLMDSANVAARDSSGHTPEEIQQIIMGAWGQQVQQTGASRELAESIFNKVIGPKLPKGTRGQLAADVFDGLYSDEEEAAAAPAPAPAPAPAAKAAAKAAPAPALTPIVANIDHDGTGEVDAEDLAWIAEHSEKPAKKSSHRGKKGHRSHRSHRPNNNHDGSGELGADDLAWIHAH